ncbi:MAG: hypothetical protein HDS62_09495 [Bacteroidales bacterium]|nr:hypothetical protein [Bacteroidales bacterium]
MTAKEKRELNVIKRAERTVIRIDKELENLNKAREKLSTESVEYFLIGQAKGQLMEAQSDLKIVISRMRNK